MIHIFYYVWDKTQEEEESVSNYGNYFFSILLIYSHVIYGRTKLEFDLSWDLFRISKISSEFHGLYLSFKDSF